MRVMLDTNILVSAFIFKSEKINKLIEILSNKHRIVIASYCIEELQELIEKKFNVDKKSLDRFLLTFPF